MTKFRASHPRLNNAIPYPRPHGDPPISPHRSCPFSHSTTRHATFSSDLSHFSFKAHSHTISTRHPSANRRFTFLSSRALLAENFSAQNSRRDDGVVEYLHPCECQKQPCTKTTDLKRENTRSGDPGSFRSCKRYRRPSRCNALRRRISGPVSRCRTDAMIRERTDLLTVSTTLTPYRRSWW